MQARLSGRFRARTRADHLRELIFRRRRDQLHARQTVHQARQHVEEMEETVQTVQPQVFEMIDRTDHRGDESNLAAAAFRAELEGLREEDDEGMRNYGGLSA